jgi:glycosyltransferase involved in cell wall biosynthesis
LTQRAVDIVLPTFARPHTVAYAIRSVLAQTHGDFTLQVVGDGCDDATEAIVRAERDPRVRFQRFPKAMGFGYVHRNRVLARADAPFVAYMTDDDLWFPDHLERGLAQLEERGLGLVAFRSIQVKHPDVLDPYFFAFDWRLLGAGRFLRHWFMGAVGCIHRRSVFDAVGYWDDHLFRFGDRDFYNRVRVSEVPSAYVPHPTVLRFYAQHWDPRYVEGALPPQAAYLQKLQDASWRQQVYDALAEPARSWAVRRRQARDFLAFGIRSGPKFARFWWQKLGSPARPAPP